MSVALAAGDRASEPMAQPNRAWTALALYVLAAAFDGFDGQVVSFLAPTLSRAWHVPVASFGAIFSLGLLGLTIGGGVLAPLADRLGRRALVVGAALAVGCATIGSAFSQSLPQLAAWRFATGLGLGAMMPVLIALAHEDAPPHRRTMAVAILVTGFPAGGFVGGMIVAWGLTRYSWSSLLVGAGVVALLLALLLALVAPARVTRPITAEKATPVALFRDGRARATVLIWLLFFATLANVYMLASWLPALLERAGLAPGQAVFASALLNGGGAVGGLVLGGLLSRLGTRMLAIVFLLGAAALAGLGLAGGAVALVFALSFCVGVLIPGGHVCNNALAAGLYPDALRATGIGWAQSVGRISTVISPLLVAVAIGHATSNAVIFASAGLASLLAAAAALMLRRHVAPGKDKA